MQQNVATYVSRGSVASLSCQGHAFSDVIFEMLQPSQLWCLHWHLNLLPP